jgi:hypothetical protein
VKRFIVFSWLLLAAACSAGTDRPDNAAALADIRAGRSGDEVVVQGVVTRVYSTARGESGSHERFDVRIASDSASQTVFVADNITVGEAAPVRDGSDVIVKGVLEIDPAGPVIHWTHHDPRMRHPAGFVEVQGKRYD